MSTVTTPPRVDNCISAHSARNPGRPDVSPGRTNDRVDELICLTAFLTPELWRLRASPSSEG
jgi:hypothetical protein